MKYIHKIAASLFLVGGLLLTGCKSDFLDTRPSASLPEEDLKDTKSLTWLLNGIHYGMYGYSFGDQSFGRGISGINIYLDLLGDDVVSTKTALYEDWYNYKIIDDNTSSIIWRYWDFYYTVLANTNEIINKVDTVVPEAERSTIAWKQLKAGAYAFRAYAYANLVQLYAVRYDPQDPNNNANRAVPIRLEKSKDPAPWNTVAEVYEQINKDLDVAESLLQDLSVDTDKKNQWSYAALMGVRARVALAQHKFAEAAEYARKGIERAETYYGVRLDRGEELLSGFLSKADPEWIWAYAPTASQNFGYDDITATWGYNATSSRVGEAHYAINREIYDQMGVNDIRRKWWVCMDLNMPFPDDMSLVLIPSEIKEKGYSAIALDSEVEEVGQQVKFKAQGALDFKSDRLVMRLAELYFIEAEGLARSSQEAEALVVLNKIMVTRDPDYNFTEVTRESLLSEISRNKRIELWLEGQRFFDLKREAIPVNITHVNSQKLLFLNQYKAGAGTDRFNEAENRIADHKGPQSPTDPKWVFATPLKETENNPYY